MRTSSIHRVPAGSGAEGGRFTRSGHTESEVELDATPAAATNRIDRKTPRVIAITGLARDHCAGSDSDRYPEFRRYTDSLTETDAQHHWLKLTEAIRQLDRFDDPDTGEQAAEDALEAGDAAIIGNRSLSDYEQFNDADRPGENDYIGYDFPQAAEDLTADWEAKVDQAAIDAAQAVSQDERRTRRRTTARLAHAYPAA